MDYTEKPNLGDYDANQFFTPETSPFDVSAHTVYSVYSGSIAYGTNTPESDVDIRGVVVPPLKYAFGLSNFEQVENQKKDVCFYSLRKFIQLAYKNGPHALEMLFIDPKFVNIVTPLFEKLLVHKHKFLSNQLIYSFGGYAWQQLAVLRTKKANNTGRVHLIEKYGYDTKLFAHAVRLYRMGREVLLTGELNVLRPDAKELLEIRNGKYSFEEAVQFDEQVVDGKKKLLVVGGMIHEEHQKFEEATKQSVLPAHPDFKFIENLAIELHKEYYNGE